MFDHFLGRLEGVLVAIELRLKVFLGVFCRAVKEIYYLNLFRGEVIVVYDEFIIDLRFLVLVRWVLFIRESFRIRDLRRFYDRDRG